MNTFFSSIGPNLAARIPQPQKHFSSFLAKQKDAGSFVFKPSPLLKLKLKSCLYLLIRYTDCILVLLAFWNVPVKSPLALYANLLKIQLKLGPTRRNWSIPKSFQFIKGRTKQFLLTIILSLYYLFSIEFSKKWCIVG